MEKSKNFLSNQQNNFERLAFAYGIQPVICTLLGEIVYQKLHESWQSGHRSGWLQAINRLNADPAQTN